MIFFNKSGVGSKLGLDFLASVIDQEYQGEICLNVVNTGNSHVKIFRGMKLGQGILIPMNYAKVVEVDLKDLYSKESDRGENGFGSTGI